MGGHGVAEMPATDHQRLIRETAENSGQPLEVRKRKQQRAQNQSHAVEMVQRHLGEIVFHDVAIDERTIERLLDGRDDDAHAEDADDDERPSNGRAFAEMRERIPDAFRRVFE